MTKKKSHQNKGKRAVLKGDALMAAGQPKKAVVSYRKALDTDPSNKALYDKLLMAIDKLPGEWGLEEFAESLSLEMQKQEIDHPPMKQVHAKLSPEWKKATGLALEIMNLSEHAVVEKKIEELVEMGEIATRALVGLLLSMKEASSSRE